MNEWRSTERDLRRAARVPRPNLARFRRQVFAPRAIVLSSIALAACQPVSAPEQVAVTPVLDSSFNNCVDPEVKTAVSRAMQPGGDEVGIYGYHIDIENDIISICNPRLRRESIEINLISSNPAYSYLNAAVEAQTQAVINERIRTKVEADRQKPEQDAPRLKAEKEQEDSTLSFYYLCLQNHSRIMALNSSEPAEIVAQASFSSCIEEQSAVFEIYKRHNSYWSYEIMERIETKFKQALLLEVIKARTQPVTPPAATPTKPETPI